MADVDLYYYLSKVNSNFPTLSSAEQSRKEVAQFITCLESQYRQLKQYAGKEARLVCNLSQNNLAFEHLQYFAETLQASPVQLYALDLSCSRIFAPTWREVLPLVKQLLNKAMHVDLAGNYLPAVLPEQLELQDMLKQNVSLTAPNRYLGSTDWERRWTSKAHDFRRIAYRSVFVTQQHLAIPGKFLQLPLAAGRKTVTLSERVEQICKPHQAAQADPLRSWLMGGLTAKAVAATWRTKLVCLLPLNLLQVTAVSAAMQICISRAWHTSLQTHASSSRQCSKWSELGSQVFPGSACVTLCRISVLQVLWSWAS